MAFSDITAEDIEFAKFASHEFADWGFRHLTQVQQGRMTYKQYIHEMLLLVLTQFKCDGEKSWRFLSQAVSEDTLKDCQRYVVYARQELVKKGLIKQ